MNLFRYVFRNEEAVRFADQQALDIIVSVLENEPAVTFEETEDTFELVTHKLPLKQIEALQAIRGVCLSELEDEFFHIQLKKRAPAYKIRNVVLVSLVLFLLINLTLTNL